MATTLSFLPNSSLATLIPTTGMNSVTGLNSAISTSVGSGPSTTGVLPFGLPLVSQYFFTVPFANNQPVLYKLEINPGQNTNPTGGQTYEFIFPLTPSSINKSVVNLTNYYDVKGGSTNFGVQRIIDLYGLTPPIITISGTTGFQFHNVDGFQWSGRSSFALLVQFLQTYATLVAQATNSNPPSAMPIMTFYDGYTGEAFTVVPLSTQAYSMDVSKPIIQTYNLQFLATATQTPDSVALSSQDLLVQIFITAKAILTAAFLEWWNAILATLPGGIIQ